MKPLFTLACLLMIQVVFAQSFIEDTSVPFEGVEESAVAFSDIDNDGDLDVLITGRNASMVPTATLYTNDGNGGFTTVTGTPFTGVEYSALAFSDVDGDLDPDVLITGQNSAGYNTAKLYINDGLGNFTEANGAPFLGVGWGAVAFSDVDGDQDQDVLIVGLSSSILRTATLYLNDGMGVFSPVANTVFDGVQEGTATFSDVDGDGDEDVLITGRSRNTVNVATLYLNDGTGTFSLANGARFTGVVNGSVVFSDVNGDGDDDVFISGRDYNLIPITKLYFNDGTGAFSENLLTPFVGAGKGSAAMGDLDGDGDEDVLLTGENNTFMGITELYINGGIGLYTRAGSTNFDKVRRSAIAFSDVDGDNKTDVLITGWNGTTQIAKLYKNGGVASSLEGLSFTSQFNFTFSPTQPEGNGYVLGIHSTIQGTAEIQVHDLTGRQVYHQQKWLTIGEQEFPLDIPTLGAGWYTVSVQARGERKVLKFSTH